MKWKKRLTTYAIVIAVAAAIMLGVVSLERGHGEGGEALLIRALSDGCFTVAVLYIGCGVLMLIQEAGNFYGIQFLLHTLVWTFSPRKGRLEERKTYYVYCQERKEHQAAEGKSPVKPAMLLTGAVCLALSLLLAMLCLQNASP